MSAEVVVRRARRGDEAARAALLRRSLRISYAQTCLYFFFQEFTLQCCVLAGAILFIFMGWGPLGCCALLPAAAGVVALGVYATNIGLVEKQLQSMRGELAGWVAETGAAAAAGAPQRCAVRLLAEDGPDLAHPPNTLQIVGTVSVARHWEPRRSGWLHALHVDPLWRRRGVGRALAAAARRWAAGGGLESLEAVTSELQPAARSCLHAAGWQLRGTYRRRVVGGAVTLPLAQLGLDLPHA